MKNIIYTLLLIFGCTQDKKAKGVFYEIKVENKNFIEILLNNHTDKNYFFVHTNLHFIKMNEGHRKNIVTEDIISEINYKPTSFSLYKVLDSQKVYIPKSFVNKKCDPLIFKLKAGENIRFRYQILNREELSPGKYSVILDDFSCKSDSVKKIIIPQYDYYLGKILIPKTINIK